MVDANLKEKIKDLKAYLEKEGTINVAKIKIVKSEVKVLVEYVEPKTNSAKKALYLFNLNKEEEKSEDNLIEELNSRLF